MFRGILFAEVDDVRTIRLSCVVADVSSIRATWNGTKYVIETSHNVLGDDRWKTVATEKTEDEMFVTFMRLAVLN